MNFDCNWSCYMVTNGKMHFFASLISNDSLLLLATFRNRETRKISRIRSNDLCILYDESQLKTEYFVPVEIAGKRKRKWTFFFFFKMHIAIILSCSYFVYVRASIWLRSFQKPLEKKWFYAVGLRRFTFFSFSMSRILIFSSVAIV